MKIKGTALPQQAHSSVRKTDKKTISMQGYDALNRGEHIEGMHINGTMSPLRGEEGERSPESCECLRATDRVGASWGGVNTDRGTRESRAHARRHPQTLLRTTQ